MTRNLGLKFLEHIAQIQPGYYPIRDAKTFLIHFNKLLPHPLSSQEMGFIDRYLRGCFNTRAHEKICLVHNWDVNILLDHLDQQTENKNISFNKLGGKAAMLIILAKMCHIGELTLIDINRTGCPMMDARNSLSLNSQILSFAWYKPSMNIYNKQNLSGMILLHYL